MQKKQERKKGGGKTEQQKKEEGRTDRQTITIHAAPASLESVESGTNR